MSKRVLERCLHEIKNLSDKVSKKEDHGWEGVQRRILLLSDLEKEINKE